MDCENGVIGFACRILDRIIILTLRRGCEWVVERRGLLMSMMGIFLLKAIDVNNLHIVFYGMEK